MKNLVILRKNAGMTQKDLAEKIGISKANIGFYETGKTQPSLEILIKIADVFGCSVDYLLGHQNSVESSSSTSVTEFLSEDKRKAISVIKTLDDAQMVALIGYLGHITGKSLDDLMEEAVDRYLQKK